MKNKYLTFICVQPCIPYYAWQIEVMLHNFQKLGLHVYDIRCLFAYNKTESDWEEKVATIKKVEQKYKLVAKFYYYEDTRTFPLTYISSIRPNILKQHFKEYPELNSRAIFYHDCDIVFTKHPDFIKEYLQDDNNWYVSDTISYIGHDYIVSKGEEVLDKMCDIVGINKKLVKEKQNESGGAQYILKGVDWQFFEKMEKDCENLFREITFYNKFRKQKEPSYHELQIWCADMWAILWGGWMRGYNTKIIPEMDFCWATDDVSKWYARYIFHNAGVVEGQKDSLFYKGQFTNKLPYNDNLEKYSQTKASWKYVEIIKEVKENTCL
jgi:hypothetical protein